MPTATAAADHGRPISGDGATIPPSTLEMSTTSCLCPFAHPIIAQREIFLTKL